jgi:hypothetical protein
MSLRQALKKSLEEHNSATVVSHLSSSFTNSSRPSSISSSSRNANLSSYEIARIQRIHENKLQLQVLGVTKTKNSLKKDSNLSNENKRKKRKRKTNTKKQRPIFKTRYSKRTEGSTKNYIDVRTNFDFFDGDRNDIVRAETMYREGLGLHKGKFGRRGGVRATGKRRQLAPKDFMLPDGWRVIQKRRKAGSTKGRCDQYYQPPDSDFWLRSMAEVYRYVTGLSNEANKSEDDQSLEH